MCLCLHMHARSAPLSARGLRALPLPRLYRAWREQARLLAYEWRDPHLYMAHAALARTAIEFVRDAQRSRASTADDADARRTSAERRHRQSCARVRKLANANLGWPHAVARALEQAYARRGKPRRALLNVRRLLMQLLAPPHPSPAVGDEAKYAPRQRLPYIPPILRTLLLSTHAQRGAPAKESTLQCPPKLRIALDSAARVPGKTVARRRVANAHWWYVTEHMSRLRLPLGVQVGTQGVGLDTMHALEAKAQPRDTTVPRRVREAREAASKAEGGAPAAAAAEDMPSTPPRFLARARALADTAGTTVPRCRLPRAQRTGSWKHARTDYTRRPRAQRRQWARILAQTPTLHLATDEEVARSVQTYAEALDMHAAVVGRVRQPWDDARRALRAVTHAAHQARVRGSKLHASVHVSEAAVGARGSRRTARSTSGADEWALLEGRRSRT